MTWLGFALILSSVSLSALGQTLFKIGVGRVSFAETAGPIAKSAAMFLSPWILAGLMAYGIGTLLWLFALRKIDLSLAYPLVAISFVMVVGIGVFFLGEPLSPIKLAGVTVIIAGVTLLAFA
jgi:multidrug transporter EmrE-like cation transporter